VAHRMIYTVEVKHEGLNKYHAFRGPDARILQERANALADRWREEFARKEAADAHRSARARSAQAKEAKKALAAEKSAEAQAEHDRLSTLLESALKAASAIDWEKLKNKTPFREVKPVLAAEPARPSEPRADDSVFAPAISFLDRLIASRRARKEAAARERFDAACSRWRDECARVEAECEQAKQRHVVAVSEWEAKKAAYAAERAVENSRVDERRDTYLSRNADAIADYCESVLNNSSYPSYFPGDFELDYVEATKTLIVDYQLPPKEEIPRTQEVRYVQSKDEFKEVPIADAQFNKLYDSVLYQIALRSVHELLTADVVGALDAVAFNGWVKSIDPATGKETTGCILSLLVGRKEFEAINLAAVEPKACFKSLKGVASSALHSLTPIAPVLQMDKADRRFIDSYGVVGSLGDETNLASIPWEDFEHLIREIFEQEFAQAGGEVKVTQASRDGGVDAVAFDPDPIRGGKIVIQAKRYTHTVGVAAVRDLYGTVHNEGATKGILVTTSDYGPDAYEFARGKPLTLLSGSNLLHLLAKHGHRARIDLVEARRLAANGDPSVTK
jgi:restriction system protein